MRHTLLRCRLLMSGARALARPPAATARPNASGARLDTKTLDTRGIPA